METNRFGKTRAEQEKGEELRTETSSVPEDRFQAKQQVQPADEAEHAEAPDNSFKLKRQKASGSQLRQEVASKMIRSQNISGEIPSNVTGLRTLSFSGDDGTVLGSTASAPIVGSSNRADSRFGKKMDATAKKINYVPSEQVLTEFDESKPLAETKDAVQGYNGTYRSEQVRQQKKSGGVPGELLFDRSVDEILRDQAYFTTGQVVKQQGVNYFDTPTKTVTGYTNNQPVVSDYSLTRGNYLHRNLKVTIESNGKISGFQFTTVDLTPDPVSASVANMASANEIIDMNKAELDRQNMDHKAGDEKADIWTPLARAIQQPTQTVGYLRDIENITATEVFMSYKKTALAHSYQLNKAAKDGQHSIRPMNEALLGLIGPEISSADYSGINAFDKSYYKNGASSLMIALYDSVSKYKTKADLLIQPRSFKMHLQTADNNMNPLRMKPEFAAIVNGEEVFSTIDREYDPNAPVCISDRTGLIHCYNFNDLYSFSSLDSNNQPVFTKDLFQYSYSDLRNNYIVRATIPLLEGIHEWFSQNGVRLYELVRDSANDTAAKTITIPMIHSTCFFSLWSLIVLAATPFILNKRVSSLRDVLYYETNVEYPFSQLKKIEEMNPMNASNYSNDNYLEPIIVKEMLPSTAASWILPELFIPFDELTTADTYTYILPYYFNENQFEVNGSNVLLKDRSGMMSYPSTRSGVRLAYLDDVYSMDERSFRLCLDKMVFPLSDTIPSSDYFIYKYGLNGDGIPAVNLSKTQLTSTAIMSTPRELGWFMVTPFGVLHSMDNSSTATNNWNNFDDMTNAIFGQSSYRIKYWHADGEVNGITILSPSTMNVSRAANFQQQWDSIPACLTGGSNQLTVRDPGFLPSLGYMFTSNSNGNIEPVSGRSLFAPFVTQAANGSQTKVTDARFNILSMQKYFWFRLQKLPMALSPWDASSMTRVAGEDAVKSDPFDFLYYFGLSGFRASDYNEDIYNRETERYNKGYLFTSDPFVASSPIFKDSIKYTEV